MVPAPTAIDLPKKERRLIERFKGFAISPKLSSRVSTFMVGSFTLGFNFEVVNNDAVELLIGFILRTLATPVASAAIAHW
jgi:multisubunit Na+/H+ antiporter MnhG subunit